MIPRKNNKPSQESKEETIKKENLERFNENVLSIVIMFSVVMSVILFANKQYLYMLFFLPMTLFADSIFNFVKKFKDHVFRFSKKDRITHFNNRALVIFNQEFEEAYYRSAFISLSVVAIYLTSYFFIPFLSFALLALPMLLLFLYGMYLRAESLHENNITITKSGINITNKYRKQSTTKTITSSSIKSILLQKNGNFHDFQIYTLDNKLIKFSISNNEKKEILPFIEKCLNVEAILENNTKDGQTLRYWSKSKKRSPRKVPNIGEELSDYKSNYFEILHLDKIKLINSKINANSLKINTHKETVTTIRHWHGEKIIKFKDIKQLGYHIEESSSNRYTCTIYVKTDHETIVIFQDVITTNDTSEMEIIDIDLDFKNITAIIDMTIKASIDKSLDTLDLRNIPTNDQELTLKEIEKLNNLND